MGTSPAFGSFRLRSHPNVGQTLRTWPWVALPELSPKAQEWFVGAVAGGSLVPEVGAPPTSNPWPLKHGPSSTPTSPHAPCARVAPLWAQLCLRAPLCLPLPYPTALLPHQQETHPGPIMVARRARGSGDCPPPPHALPAAAADDSSDAGPESGAVEAPDLEVVLPGCVRVRVAQSAAPGLEAQGTRGTGIPPTIWRHPHCSEREKAVSLL